MTRLLVTVFVVVAGCASPAPGPAGLEGQEPRVPPLPDERVNFTSASNERAYANPRPQPTVLNSSQPRGWNLKVGEIDVIYLNVTPRLGFTREYCIQAKIDEHLRIVNGSLSYEGSVGPSGIQLSAEVEAVSAGISYVTGEWRSFGPCKGSAVAEFGLTIAPANATEPGP